MIDQQRRLVRKRQQRRNRERLRKLQPLGNLLGDLADVDGELPVDATASALRPSAEPALDLYRLDVSGELGSIVAAAQSRPSQQPGIWVRVAARHPAQRRLGFDDERSQTVIGEPERA